MKQKSNKNGMAMKYENTLQQTGKIERIIIRA